jgi:hypothetical protein
MPHIIKMMDQVIKIIRARKAVRVRRHNKRDNERVRDKPHSPEVTDTLLGLFA